MRLSAQAPVTHMLSSSEKFQIISCCQLHPCLLPHCTKFPCYPSISQISDQYVKQRKKKMLCKTLSGLFLTGFSYQQAPFGLPSSAIGDIFLLFSLLLFTISKEVKKGVQPHSIPGAWVPLPETVQKPRFICLRQNIQPASLGLGGLISLS